jgi:TonB family protein
MESIEAERSTRTGVQHQQEAHMRLAVLALALALVVQGRAAAAPQELRDKPGPAELSANPITAENPIPRRTLGVTPVYPPEASAIGATGRVAVRVTIDEFGRVAEVRRPIAPSLVYPSSPATTEQLVTAVEALLTATANAVRQWQYDPPSQPPVSFNVTIAFTPASEPSVISQESSTERARERTERPPIPRVSLADPAWADDAVRIGGDVQAPVKTRNVSPVYPTEAREARVQGIVIVEARIGEDGRVTKARVLRSIPELDQAALDAVAQWEFTPTLLNGQPLAVVTTVTISFTLAPND